MKEGQTVVSLEQEYLVLVYLHRLLGKVNAFQDQVGCSAASSSGAKLPSGLQQQHFLLNRG